MSESKRNEVHVVYVHRGADRSIASTTAVDLWLAAVPENEAVSAVRRKARTSGQVVLAGRRYPEEAARAMGISPGDVTALSAAASRPAE